MNFRPTLATGVLFALSAMSVPASAAVLYNNPPDNTGGDCSFSTTCAATAGRGDDFAAQRFSLVSSADITSVDYNIIHSDPSHTPTSTNWAFYSANGAGGSPGTLLASGSLAPTTANGTVNCGGTCYDYLVNVGNVLLGPGTYYLALQDVSAFFDNYLAFGSDTVNPAYETHDGGLTWSSNYEFHFSVSASVEGGDAAAIPEPSGLSLVGTMLIALWAFRRRWAV